MSVIRFLQIILINFTINISLFSQDDSSQKFPNEQENLSPRIISISPSMKFKIRVDTLKLLDSNSILNSYKGRITITDMEDNKKKVIFNIDFSVIYRVYHYENFIYIYYINKMVASHNAILKINMQKQKKYHIANGRYSTGIIGIDSNYIYLKIRKRYRLGHEPPCYRISHTNSKKQSVLFDTKQEIIFSNNVLLVECYCHKPFIIVRANNKNKTTLLNLENHITSNTTLWNMYFKEYLVFHTGNTIYLVNHTKIDDVRYIDEHRIEKIIPLKNSYSYGLRSIKTEGNKIYMNVYVYFKNKNKKVIKIALDINKLPIKNSEH